MFTTAAKPQHVSVEGTAIAAPLGKTLAMDPPGRGEEWKEAEARFLEQPQQSAPGQPEIIGPSRDGQD
jgi:hypothetical protein